MKICVLNGSPKGNYSITLQTVHFLERKFDDAQFDILNVGQKIKAYEKDMSEAIARIKDSDLILFAYPVYTFIAPYQLHRFIELLKESGENLSGKYVAQLTTSKHFYDVTAHNYVKENCFDLGLKYVGGLSADMEDLLTEKGQDDAVKFFKYVRFAISNDVYEKSSLVAPKHADYVASLESVEKCGNYDTLILTNMQDGDNSLKGMIDDFVAVHPYSTRIINIADYPFASGCLGCFKCASSGKCVHKDKFDTFLRENIQTANAIVYAFTIKDHSMGASFKMYDDRQFCNGHRTVTMGMPVGYLINGDLSVEGNLKTVIEGRADVGRNYLAGCATDKDGITHLSKKLCYALDNKLVLPQTFLGVGGLKIFRDLIYVMRGMMRADHKFYKEHGFYDFPQKKKGTIIKMKLVGSLLANEKIVAKMGNMMNEGMLMPYKQLFDKMDKEKNKKK